LRIILKRHEAIRRIEEAFSAIVAILCRPSFFLECRDRFFNGANSLRIIG
jgi:hypothetical protein